MKFLHTADWHVGKTLKGRDRLDEQKSVLNEIVGIAEANEVDAVLIAGDVYDSTAPSAPAQQLVVRTLLRLRQTGAQVIVIAGNHDHGPTFEAYRPLMGEIGITLAGMCRPPEKGGLVGSLPALTARTPRLPSFRSCPSGTPCARRRSSPTPPRRTPAPTTRWSARSSRR